MLEFFLKDKLSVLHVGNINVDSRKEFICCGLSVLEIRVLVLIGSN